MFWGYSIWWLIKQYSKLEWKSINKSLVAELWKASEMYKRMYDVHGEACLRKKLHGFATITLSLKKLSVKLKYTDSPLYEKFWAQRWLKSYKQSSGHERTHHCRFPRKRCNYKEGFGNISPIYCMALVCIERQTNHDHVEEF